MIFREARPADDIAGLRRRCFPEDQIEKHFPVARAFVAEAEGRVVAHLGFIEQPVMGYPAALAFDAMTDAAYRGQGVFSRLAAFAADEIRGDYALSTAWQIRPAVLPAMVRAGWLPILRAPVFVRPIWSAAAPAAALLRRSEAAAPQLRCGNRERQLALPHSRFTAPYYTCTENLVTRETILKGYRTLAIVDLTPDAKQELKAALKSTTCRLAAALLSWRHPALPLLLRMGFLPSPHRFRFLVNVFDPRIDAKRVKWVLSWADTDHL
ncbi:MAG TPA: GNAT family N-acetyltransferase [Thermoanaerobaculia bacterium]|nr:GNAT family N-acetyltransferase [Thermoanaerobaculia bacterium]